MLSVPIEDIELADLKSLVDNRVAENRRLEFKRDHYGRKEDDRREFAADVSAFANSQGGDLVIGVAEANGSALELTGVAAENPDQLVRAIVESLRTSIEPVIEEVRVAWIELSPGRGVVVIRVPRSWSAPHRVTVAKDNRFFIRDENGKHPMSVEELRRAFLFGSEIENRLRALRAERLTLLAANEGPLATTTDEPRMIVHLVPLASLTEPTQVAFERHPAGIGPLGASGWNDMFSIDGLVTYSGPKERFETVRAFTTFFRNGIIEAVGTVHTGERNGNRIVNLAGVEQDAARFVRRGVKEYEHYAIGAPLYFLLSIIGVRGLSANVGEWHGGIAYPHRSDNVLLPELRLEASQLKDLDEALRPIFNLLWNAFGQRNSPAIDTRFA